VLLTDNKDVVLFCNVWLGSGKRFFRW